MKKKIIATILAVAMTATSVSGITSYRFYKKLIKKQSIAKVREYYCEDLTYEILATRGDDIIIEKIIGVVTNNRRDGKILESGDAGDYISYRCVRGAKKGDTILTVCIYNPGTTAEDDIVSRFDYIIDRGR